MIMSDSIPGEVINITDEAIESFVSSGGQTPAYHTILEVWREVLKPALEESSAKITPAWANRMVTSYQEITFNDMEAYRTSYFSKIIQLLDILQMEIASDTDCLNHLSPEEDREENAVHYKNLLLTWQQAIQQWEMEWSTMDENAAVEVAAISEVHKMFFGQVGLTEYLDNIQFQFTEADQAMLAEALMAQRDGQ